MLFPLFPISGKAVLHVHSLDLSTRCLSSANFRLVVVGASIPVPAQPQYALISECVMSVVGFDPCPCHPDCYFCAELFWLIHSEEPFPIIILHISWYPSCWANAMLVSSGRKDARGLDSEVSALSSSPMQPKPAA